MVIVVTGGAGFIGANFIIYMMQKYPANRLICLDKLTYCANLANLQEVRSLPNFRFVQGDICDRSVIERLFSEEQPDMVVNFAAESHVDRSITGPEIFVQTNVLGTQVLLDACLKHKVKRFHQISTDEVYGDLPLERPDLKFTEMTPLKTSSPYSASKAGADLLVLAYYRTYGLPVTISRCSNNYGRFQFPEKLIPPSSPYSASKAGADLLVLAYYRTYGLPVTISRCSNNYGRFQFPEKLIPLMVSKALAKEQLPVYGNGLNVRDWIYVDDHCEAVDLILQQGKVGEVYNIGGQKEISNLELVRLICRSLQCSEELITYVKDRDLILQQGKVGEVYNIGGQKEISNLELVRLICRSLQCSEELITYVKDRPGHDLRYAMDTTKISTKLGWQPRTSFEIGLQKTIMWYVEHQNWWNFMHK